MHILTSTLTLIGPLEATDAHFDLNPDLNWTSGGNNCIPGITRGNILKLCRDNGIPCYEKASIIHDFSMY